MEEKQLTRQERLFGEREEEYGQITVQNSKLYPFVKLVDSVVDEAKVEFNDGTVYTNVVDPANVAVVEAEMDAGEIEGEFSLGLDLDFLSGRLQNKPRSSSNDVEVAIDAAYPHSTLTFEHEVKEYDITHTDRLGVIDPDFIREQPDIPETESTAEATLPLSVLRNFVHNAPDNSAGFKIRVEDGEFQIGQIAENSTYQSLVTVSGNDVASGEGEAIYSNGYLENITTGLKTAGIEMIDLRWQDEYPLTILFDSGFYSGRYVLAPRIQS